MQLTYEQKMSIYEKGYVQISGVIPQVMINQAVRAINHALGEGIDPTEIQIFRSRSFCPELQREPVITDLLNKTPALALAESAIGPGQTKPITAGQIALRFPTLQDPPTPPRPHLDGMYSPHNGVPKGEIRNFTMLLGVALSEVSTPYSGNLSVWPGSHHIYERYFRERGPEALLDGMPKVDLPEPVQLLAKPGDVILAHYELAHGVAMNTSPFPRYAIYFRLHHVDHDRRSKETMTDIWLEWDGMRDIVAEKTQGQATPQST